jgi:hypothetical protein
VQDQLVAFEDVDRDGEFVAIMLEGRGGDDNRFGVAVLFVVMSVGMVRVRRDVWKYI